MEKQLCGTCQDSKTLLKCGLCQEATCKSCAHFADEETFSFLPKVPAHLTKGVYCHACFQDQVAADFESYQQTLKKARGIDLYFRDQGKETRFVRRDEEPYVIEECADHDELVLRLAFLAALNGFATLVDVEITGRKIRNGSHNKTVYRGTGRPANIKQGQIPKDRSLRMSPN